MLDWLSTHVIGILVVSYWRGTWTLLDIYTCNQPKDATLMNSMSFCFANDYETQVRVYSGWLSYFVGNLLLALGIYLSWKKSIWNHSHHRPTDDEESFVGSVYQSVHLAPDDSRKNGRTYVPSFMKCIQRFVLVYILGLASVNIWRGIWYLSDAYIWNQSLHKSLIFTTSAGMICAFLIGCGNSLLAPPACFILDGPTTSSSSLSPPSSTTTTPITTTTKNQKQQPPLLGTILGTYYSTILPQNDEMKNYDEVKEKRILNLINIHVLDVTMTFIVLPILVVWFWRGSWGLFDVLLWGYESQWKLYLSLLFGMVIAFGGLFIGSLDGSFLPSPSTSIRLYTFSFVFKRIQTAILAISTVSFWRVVWYTWDEFIGGSTLWSGWVSHILSIGGLVLMGCMSCIVASPTVVAVDADAHPDSKEEPLVCSIPVKSDTLKFMAIAR